MSENKPENPPAFPGPYQNSIMHNVNGAGMTLRDYFAGQALQGFCARNIPPVSGNNTTISYAEISYTIADAMLKAREV